MQLMKNCKVEKFRSAAKGLTAAVQANSEYVIKQRRKLDCSPKDIAVLEKFMSTKADREQVISTLSGQTLASFELGKRVTW